MPSLNYTLAHLLNRNAQVINSSANCFPLLLLAGSSMSQTVGKGDFQEMDAVAMLSRHVKVALRPNTFEAIPAAMSRAYRMSWYQPSTGFVDLPADLLMARHASASTEPPQIIPNPPLPQPDVQTVHKIAALLRIASAPLVVIGKGSAYARAESDIRSLIYSTRLPFLPTPMGKGVVPDSHPGNTSAARSIALRHADVVLVLGARLNWILHFGEHPKWNSKAKIVQVDINADVIGQNAGDATLGVIADVGAFVLALIPRLKGWQYAENTAFRALLAEETAKNANILAKKAQLSTVPMSFEHAYHIIRSSIDVLSPPEDGGIVYISEGARTMDTSRQWFYQEHPRLRLDAGTHGTMGVGFGYMIAAWEAYNGPFAEAKSGKNGSKKVVGLIGDSATGFSGMEIETMSRMGQDCLIFVMNNGGVYHGSADSLEEYRQQQSATKEGRSKDGHRSWSLGFETRYDQFANAVGGKGYLVRTPDELRRATEEGYRLEVPVIINVLVESGRGFPAVRIRSRITILAI